MGKPDVERDVSSDASRPLRVSVRPAVVPARHGNTNLRAKEAAFGGASVLTLPFNSRPGSRTDMQNLEKRGYRRDAPTGTATRKPAWVGPLRTFMVRRGSTVRVRQRASRKDLQIGLFR